jgi:NCAIR mutase (PurE)-related protein
MSDREVIEDVKVVPSSQGFHRVADRLKVPGGWVYRTIIVYAGREGATSSVHQVFVPIDQLAFVPEQE